MFSKRKLMVVSFFLITALLVVAGCANRQPAAPAGGQAAPQQTFRATSGHHLAEFYHAAPDAGQMGGGC
ncbi:MAG: hypothetical protein KGZ45_10200 [Clostridium sp.]|nr:hypothetical protein [Clostridium sp.]